MEHWYDTRFFAGLVLITCLAHLVWTCSQTLMWRPVAYGIVWFGLALLPSSSLFPLAEVANDHRLFFPYVGLSLAVVWGVPCTRTAGSPHGPASAPWYSRQCG